MPLCIRCTGLFLFMGVAMWAGLLAPAPKNGWKGLILPVIAAMAGSGILLAQWLGAQMGFWYSNVENRLLTGFASGAGLGWVLHAAFAMRYFSSHDTGKTRRSPWMAVLSFVILSGASLGLLMANPPWPVAGALLGAGSLAGFYTACAWGMAIILSYAFKDSENRPRKAIIAPIVAVGLAIQVIFMVIVRI